MIKIKYQGRHNEVHVPVLGDVIVKNGDVVEVEDDAVARSLLEQEANWAEVGGSPPPPPPPPSNQEDEEEGGESE